MSTSGLGVEGRKPRRIAHPVPTFHSHGRVAHPLTPAVPPARLRHEERRVPSRIVPHSPLWSDRWSSTPVRYRTSRCRSVTTAPTGCCVTTSQTRSSRRRLFGCARHTSTIHQRPPITRRRLVDCVPMPYSTHQPHPRPSRLGCSSAVSRAVASPRPDRTPPAIRCAEGTTPASNSTPAWPRPGRGGSHRPPVTPPPAPPSAPSPPCRRPEPPRPTCPSAGRCAPPFPRGSRRG